MHHPLRRQQRRNGNDGRSDGNRIIRTSLHDRGGMCLRISRLHVRGMVREQVLRIPVLCRRQFLLLHRFGGCDAVCGVDREGRISLQQVLPRIQRERGLRDQCTASGISDYLRDLRGLLRAFYGPCEGRIFLQGMVRYGIRFRSVRSRAEDRPLPRRRTEVEDTDAVRRMGTEGHRRRRYFRDRYIRRRFRGPAFRLRSFG